ncbi:glycosyltransferase family 4 protein [Bradyrhizobium manausense]|uniref:glycosyltransferase family 4 protein n=1 Tax=Bradyrhizobium manausense TaxID=989370 RepID=UPI001BAA75D8|nr:glycosyltransferase family 4 protein [Bradyrhizobium manausense]MBR0725041.1 glycosyltransferase family 4 protein [Bradyrhizobium manausense]
MRIAIVVPSWPPGRTANGIITYASQIVPALRRLGHEVYVLTPQASVSSNDPFTIDLSQFSPTGFSGLWSRLRRQSAIELIGHQLRAALQTLKSRVGIDVLEIEESFGWSAVLSEAKIVPIIVRLHGPWFLTGVFDSNSQDAFEGRIRKEGEGIARAAIVTSPSKAGLEAVRRRYGIPLDRAKIIPNPIQPLLRGTGWKRDICEMDRILFVGRFDLLKGADVVLRAFQILARKYPNLRLTFAGPDKGISERGEKLSITQFIRRHLPESEPRIDYLGLVQPDQLLQLRPQHAFTIVASRFEMFSYAVAEAMALGSPIVASSAGAMSELIEDGATGLLFESEDVDSLVRNCERFLNDPALLEKCAQAARTFSEDRLHPDVLAKETEAAYLSALSSN